MSDCELMERSARGYCPGEEGHAAEREALLLENETTTVMAPETTTVDTLPATGGADIIAWLLIAVGTVLFGGWLLITARGGIR